MKVEAESELIGFQTWLNHSIRNAWILAFAVAIPGAFLLTLWSPHSPEALAGVALLGIAISVISDRVGEAKRRRLEELSQVTTAVQQEIQDTINLIDKRIADGITSALERAGPKAQLAEIRTAADAAVTAN